GASHEWSLVVWSARGRPVPDTEPDRSAVGAAAPLRRARCRAHIARPGAGDGRPKPVGGSRVRARGDDQADVSGRAFGGGGCDVAVLAIDGALRGCVWRWAGAVGRGCAVAE